MDVGLLEGEWAHTKCSVILTDQPHNIAPCLFHNHRSGKRNVKTNPKQHWKVKKPTSSPHQKKVLTGKREKIDNKAHKTKEAVNPTREKKEQLNKKRKWGFHWSSTGPFKSQAPEDKIREINESQGDGTAVSNFLLSE